jgi:hypothetical protein
MPGKAFPACNEASKAKGLVSIGTIERFSMSGDD